MVARIGTEITVSAKPFFLLDGASQTIVSLGLLIVEIYNNIRFTEPPS